MGTGPKLECSFVANCFRVKPQHQSPDPYKISHFALDDEARDAQQGLSILGGWKDAQGIDSFSSIALGFSPSAFERSLFVNQLQNLFTAHRFEASLPHNRFNQASVLFVALFHQIDEWKRELSFADVVRDWLSELGFGRYEIKNVVDQL